MPGEFSVPVLIMEKPVVIDRNGLQMVGMIHFPEGTKRPLPAVVMYHGFTGQKSEPHRLFVKTARALAEAGFCVARFDFIGSGDSEGDFADITLTQEIDDAFATLEYVQRLSEVDPGRIGIIGLSLGGAVAASVAGSSSVVKAACLWSAVADTSIFFRDKEAVERLEQNGYVDMGGSIVKKGFFDDLKNHDLLGRFAAYSGPVLIIHGEADSVVPVAHADMLERAAGGKTEKVIVPGADHVFSSANWETQVITKTVEWFRESL